MNHLRYIARATRPAVERLDALLVPLSGTFKDSEGVYVMTEEQTRAELVTRLRDAASAITEALEGLR